MRVGRVETTANSCLSQIVIEKYLKKKPTLEGRYERPHTPLKILDPKNVSAKEQTTVKGKGGGKCTF